MFKNIPLFFGGDPMIEYKLFYHLHLTECQPRMCAGRQCSGQVHWDDIQTPNKHNQTTLKLFGFNLGKCVKHRYSNFVAHMLILFVKFNMKDLF